MAELKLQVVLEAAERISQPALKAMRGVEGLNDEVREAQREIKALSAQKKLITNFRKVSKASADTARKLDAARTKASELTEKFEAAHKPSDKLIKRLDTAEGKLAALKKQSAAAEDELFDAKVTLKKLRKEFEATEKPTKQMQNALRVAENRVTRLGNKTNSLAERTLKAGQSVKELTKTVNGAHQPSKTLTRQYENATRAVERLEMQQERENVTLNELRRNARHVGLDLNNLSVAEVKVAEATGKANKTLAKQAEQLEKLHKRQERIRKLSDQRDKTMQVASNLTVASAGSYATGKTILDKMIDPMREALTAESGMADVKKVTEFSPEGLKAFEKNLDRLTWKIPATFEQLAAISASGGQLGITEEQLPDFTVEVAKTSIAFDMLPDVAGEAIAKMMNVYKLNVQGAGKLGDAINDLSDKTAAKASDMVMAMGRIGGVATQFGLTEIQAAALTNAFIALGKPPEAAGTAINSMLQKLQNAEKQPKKFQKALGELGISSEELAKRLNDKPQEGLLDFLQMLEKLDKKTRAGITVDLFGTEFSDDVSLLVGNLEQYEKALELVAKEENYLGSKQREFDTRSATRANQIQLLQNQYTSLKRTMGDFLLTALVPLMEKVGSLLTRVNLWVEKNPELTATIGKVTLAVGGLLVGLGAMGMVLASVIGPIAMLRYGMGMLGLKMPWVAKGSKGLGSVLWSATKATGGFVKRLAVLSSLLGRIGIDKFLSGMWSVTKATGGFVKRLAVLSSLLGRIGIDKFLTASKAVLGFGLRIGKLSALIARFGVGKILTGIGRFGGLLLTIGRIALPAVVAGIRAVTMAMLANPIGLIVTGIATAAYLIIANWDTVKQYLATFWTWIKPSLQAGWEWIKKAFSWTPLGIIVNNWSTVVSFFQTLPSSLMSIGSNIINGLINGIFGIDIKAKIAELAMGIITKFKSMLGIASPSILFTGFGRDIIQGLINGLMAMLGSVQSAIGNIGSNITSWFKQNISVEKFKNIGRNVMDGVKSGIRSKMGEVKASVTEAGAKISGWFRDKLGIRSPSRVFIEHGQMITSGLNVGMTRSANDAVAPMSKIARKLPQVAAGAALAVPMAVAAATDTPELRETSHSSEHFITQQRATSVDNSTYHITLNIESQPGMDEYALAQQVRQQLEAWERDKRRQQRGSLYDGGDFL